MHSAGSKVVVVIMGQKYSTDQNSDNSTHVQGLSNHIAQYPEKVSYSNLGDFVVN